MNKKLLLVLASVFFLATLNSCTSKNSKAEGETDVISEAEVESIENEEQPVVLEETDSSTTAETLPQEALGESQPAAVETLVDQSQESVNLDSPPPAVVENTTPAEPQPIVENAPVVAEEPVAEAPVQESAPAPVAEKPKVASASLQKVASAPWMVENTWVNAVYIARPGDTMKSISKMIYGEDRSGELKKINTRYKSRSVKPGDKVYYSSPVRQGDSSKIANYYEDAGMPSETYVAKAGDNIRKVSKNLLGYSNAWMEIWSTNSVESKGKLSEGETLRYWKGATPISTTLAGNKPKVDHSASVAMNTPPTDAANNLPPPPMPEPLNEIPPPPMPDHMAAGGVAPPPPMPPDMNQLPPPPPMPDMAQNPPPPAPDNGMLPPAPPAPDMAANNSMEQLPPPPVEPPPDLAAHAPVKEANAEETAVQGQLGTNEIMILGAIAGLAGVLAILMIRRKRQQKAAAAMMSDSQVGT